MKSSVSFFIKQFDFISQKPTLLINNTERNKSLYGAILTILAVILAIVFAVSLLMDLFERKHPKLLIYKDYYKENEVINLSSQSALFFSVLDINDQSSNYNKYFNVSIKIKACKGEPTPLAFSKCSLNSIDDNFMCLDYTNQTDDNNEGKYESYLFPSDYISFSLMACNKNESCTTPDSFVLEKIRTSQLKFVFGYLESKIDVKNVSKPFEISSTPKYFIQSLSEYMKYSWNLNLVQLKYSTDFGYIFREVEELDIVSFDDNFYVSSDLRIRGKESDPELINFTINLSNSYSINYERTFYKGQNFFAEIGGLFNCLFIMATQLNMIYSAINLNLTIDENCKLSYYALKVIYLFTPRKRELEEALNQNQQMK